MIAGHSMHGSAGDSSAASRWNLDKGGGVYACGVGGSITGRGADVLICDDLLHDSGSDGDRDAAWKWFTEVAVPRLEPKGAIIMIGTRFSEGRCLPESCSMVLMQITWTVVKLPAICNSEDDLLHRPIGSALWPERMGVAELEARKREMGTRAYECQFQQNPCRSKATSSKRNGSSDTISRRRSSRRSSAHSMQRRRPASATTTQRTRHRSALLAMPFYVLGAWHDKVEFPALLRRVASAG